MRISSDRQEAMSTLPDEDVDDEISKVHMSEVDKEMQALVDMQQEYSRLATKNNYAETQLKVEGKLGGAA